MIVRKIRLNSRSQALLLSTYENVKIVVPWTRASIDPAKSMR